MGAERLLTRAEVEERTGYKHSTIYDRIAAGTFPAPRREVETGTVRWLESEVQAWIDDWIAKSEVAGRMVGSRAQKLKKTSESAR
ncbi:helix-turn-helix transcriptional regulator [Lysobacter enzymogenes]|uniref:helix-turn-helix transcriptional regulator n=1 Tax=Lysobacter enzymogenes TaxID=69 RepID=UPI000895D5CD|nr:AlpA family phage regulatory protein [Lysobacter enzymogenes]SDW93460.1 prophage regulatory protein [Lysobacter enzymogenes]